MSDRKCDAKGRSCCACEFKPDCPYEGKETDTEPVVKPDSELLKAALEMSKNSSLCPVFFGMEFDAKKCVYSSRNGVGWSDNSGGSGKCSICRENWLRGLDK